MKNKQMIDDILAGLRVIDRQFKMSESVGKHVELMTVRENNRLKRGENARVFNDNRGYGEGRKMGD